MSVAVDHPAKDEQQHEGVKDARFREVVVAEAFAQTHHCIGHRVAVVCEFDLIEN